MQYKQNRPVKMFNKIFGGDESFAVPTLQNVYKCF